MVRVTRWIVALGALLVVLAAPTVAAAADWVGLGDSYAAGPLIPNQSLSPLGCLRSDHNFAHLAAAQRGLSLADVSCSGATTDDMTAAQRTSAGTNPPQLDALSDATRVVSLQIGGNDIGFSSIIQGCASASPFGHPCRDRYTGGGGLSDRTGGPEKGRPASPPPTCTSLGGCPRRGGPAGLVHR